MKISYQYLIAYHTMNEGELGVGRTFATYNGPITHPDQLELIEATIRDQEGVDDVFITNYQIIRLIKTEEE